MNGNFDRWLARAVRLIGSLGLCYVLFVDRLHNPADSTALIVCGGLATLPDIWGWRATNKRVEMNSDPVERPARRRRAKRS